MRQDQRHDQLAIHSGHITRDPGAADGRGRQGRPFGDRAEVEALAVDGQHVATLAHLELIVPPLRE